MKVLIIGSGAREHALAWRLSQSSQITDLWIASGNAGTAHVGTNIDVSPEDLNGIEKAARSFSIDLVVVGPETSLADGIVDRLQALGIPTFGPTRNASRLESSKSFALEVMNEASVAHPESWIFEDKQKALAYLKKRSGPIVVKTNGLAQGKGVWLCQTSEQAIRAVQTCMSEHAAEPIVFQEFLAGTEVSVFAFSDGEHLSSLVAACDYKRLNNGDKGPNTGGMGSFAQPDFWTEELARSISRDIMEPVIKVMAERDIPFRGVLYAGLMLTNQGPKVLEFNCRFGDPETQVILPLLITDPLEIMVACIEGRLNQVSIHWQKQFCVGVVMASGGYPTAYDTGFEITGLDAHDENLFIFHAGTKSIQDRNQTRIVTNGGRVLTVVARANSLTQARGLVYKKLETIQFTNAHYRTDIYAPS